MIIFDAGDADPARPDLVFGGLGRRDVLVVEDAPGGLQINLEIDRVQTRTGALVTLARLAGIENARGSAFDDDIIGDDRDNRLWGARGNDQIFAGGGNDHVFGGRGNDRLFGRDGHDNIQGGRGSDDIDGGIGGDILTGGAGGDRFVFDARLRAPFQGDDIITDYGNGSDLIRIKGGSFVDITVIADNGMTVIDYGNGRITLEGVELTVDQIDFLF